MIFFVNTALNYKMSGIEVSQVEQIKLLDEHNVKAKIVTTDYLPDLHSTLEQNELVEDQSINLYDFLEQNDSFLKRTTNIDNLHFPNTWDVQKTNTGYDYSFNNHKVVQVTFWENNYRQINTVSFFNQNGDLYKEEVWNSLGYKELERFYDLSGNKSLENIIDPNGKVVCQIHYSVNELNEIVPSLFQWINYKNKNLTFINEEEMIQFFLIEINKAEQERNNKLNYFIFDRPSKFTSVCLNIQMKSYKFLRIHSNHINYLNDNNKEINSNYFMALKNLSIWDGIIVSTKQQKKDLQKIVGEQKPIIVIPAGYTRNNKKQVSWDERKKAEIIYIGRFSLEKNQRDAIKVFIEINKRVPNAHLSFYGYVNDDSLFYLQKMVSENHLENKVHFYEYLPKLDDIYNKAQLEILTSYTEGFSLVLLEGLEHGVPQISYDINYGPRCFIKNYENGLLIKPGNIKKMANEAAYLLENDRLLKKYSKNSYKISKEFSADVVWKSWDNMFKQFN